MTPEFSGMGPFTPQQPWKSTFIDSRTGIVFIEPRDPMEEIPALASIYAESFNGAPWFEQWSFDAAQTELRECSAKGADFIVGLDTAGSPIGFGVGYSINIYSGKDLLCDLGLINRNNSERIYYIAELCTAQEARGQGVCSQVVRGLIGSARGQGYEEIITRTRSDNENMIRIFQRVGFAELGRYVTETGGVSSERVVLKFTIASE
jgi:RimJ/RimL family protein N-acetyltransferase